jgi:hypothetical protein
MMSPGRWKISICDVVEDISNEEFQRTAWFGSSSTQVSSPDELRSQFFDDFDFADFLNSPEVNLTSKQKSAGKDLKSNMEKFADSTPKHLDPREVVDDERRKEIRIAAQAFLETLDNR